MGRSKALQALDGFGVEGSSIRLGALKIIPRAHGPKTCETLHGTLEAETWGRGRSG
jgi:patatin-like phospholipase/acyl hydrolase